MGRTLKLNRDEVVSVGLTVALTPGIASRLRELAAAERRSVSAVVRGLVVQRIARADRGRRSRE